MWIQNGSNTVLFRHGKSYTVSSLKKKTCSLCCKDSSSKCTAIIVPQSSHFYLPEVIEQVLLLHSLALFLPLMCRATKFVLATQFREYVMGLALYEAIQASFFDNRSATFSTPDVYTLASLKVQTVLCTHCSSAFWKTQEIRNGSMLKCIAWDQSYIPHIP